MATQTAKAGGIEELFGEPENNPNFRADQPFFTGFSIAEIESSCIPVSAVLAPCGMDSGYRILNERDVIGPTGRKIGFLPIACPSQVHFSFFWDERGRETNYFLLNSRVGYISEACLQRMADEEARRKKERDETLFLD